MNSTGGGERSRWQNPSKPASGRGCLGVYLTPGLPRLRRYLVEPRTQDPESSAPDAVCNDLEIEYKRVTSKLDVASSSLVSRSRLPLLVRAATAMAGSCLPTQAMRASTVPFGTQIQPSRIAAWRSESGIAWHRPRAWARAISAAMRASKAWSLL